MSEWTDEERRRFDEAYAKGKADNASEKARIKVGDRVDTPQGPARVVSEEMGGFKVNLEAELPQPRRDVIVNPLSGENAFYVPSELLRRVED